MLTRRAALGLLAAAPTLLTRSIRAQSQSQTETPSNYDHPAGAEIPPGPFRGTRQSLQSYEVPEWFRDAKFGMWAHWGPQSAIEDGDWYARNMYMQGSDQYNYHLAHYGHPSKFGYKDTIPAWHAERFDPGALIRLYKAAGAKYFMSMGVHHDNFDLWDSRYQRWNSVAMGPHKDIVALWRDAARAEGLRFGVSEHLWITYKWFSTSHGSDATGPYAGVPYDGANPANFDLYVDSDQVSTNLDWNEDGIPLWWKQQWFKRIRDLVDHAQPDFLYSDGALPFEYYGYNLVAHLYNTSAKLHGGRTQAVYFSKRPEDAASGICVLDRERGVLSDISPRPWQSDTCIGDWHYKRGMKYKTPKQIIDMLVDIVSRNGNLMLNVPLPSSGYPDPEELAIVAAITEWMNVNGEAIFATRPWKIAGEGPPAIADSSKQESAFNESARRNLTAEDIRFTTKGSTLYAFVMGWPAPSQSADSTQSATSNAAPTLTIKSLAQNTPLRVGKIENVSLLGTDRKLTFQQNEKGLTITLPPEPPTKHASAFRITGAI